MESLDRIFDIFGKERRRYALYALDEADGPVEMRELAEQIREWEDDEDDVDTREYEDVYLSLRHRHLPKAARAEYIEFDREENEIRITGEPTEFQIVLAVSEAMEAPDEDSLVDLDSLAPKEFLDQLTMPSQSTD